VFRDIMSETKDVATPRASSVLQEGTEAVTLGNVRTHTRFTYGNSDLACDLLPIVIPATLIDVADIGGEGIRNGWGPCAIVAATAVDAKCNGSWDQGDRQNDKGRCAEGTHCGEVSVHCFTDVLGF
jgi:hypothetical protein